MISNTSHSTVDVQAFFLSVGDSTLSINPIGFIYSRLKLSLFISWFAVQTKLCYLYPKILHFMSSFHWPRIVSSACWHFTCISSAIVFVNVPRFHRGRLLWSQRIKTMMEQTRSEGNISILPKNSKQQWKLHSSSFYHILYILSSRFVIGCCTRI